MAKGRIMTVPEAAKYARIGEGTLRDYIHAGKLRHVVFKTRRVITRSDWVDELMEQLARDRLDEANPGA